MLELRSVEAHPRNHAAGTGDVRELIQNTSSDVWEKLELAPDDPDEFRGFVHSFANTEILTKARDHQREQARVELRAGGHTPPPTSASATMMRPLIDEQQRQLALVHVHRLPPVYRNALLHVLDGGDYKSLAANEGISTSTASSRISTASNMVKRSIAAERRTRPPYRTPPDRA